MTDRKRRLKAARQSRWRARKQEAARQKQEAADRAAWLADLDRRKAAMAPPTAKPTAAPAEPSTKCHVCGCPAYILLETGQSCCVLHDGGIRRLLPDSVIKTEKAAQEQQAGTLAPPTAQEPSHGALMREKGPSEPQKVVMETADIEQVYPKFDPAGWARSQEIWAQQVEAERAECARLVREYVESQRGRR